MTPCCNRDICNDCLAKTQRCPVCRSDLHPKLTKVQDPWEIDTDRVNSVNGPSTSAAAEASSIREVFIADDSPYHTITPEDTLVGISLKYNIPVDEIKKANKMFSSNVQERKKLLIPGKGSGQVRPKTENEQVFERRNKLKEFQRLTGTELPEGKYYMEEANYDLEAAKTQYQQDVAWERSFTETTGRTVSPQNV